MTKSRYFENKYKIADFKPSTWWEKANPSVKLRAVPYSLLGTAKAVQIVFYSIKLKKVKFCIITYNFVPKNAMKLHFDKSFDPTFKEPQRYMRRLENPKKQGDEVVFA